MRILLTGASGQVGQALAARLTGHECLTPSLEELDLSVPGSIAPFLDAAKPELILNPAAYTQVDKAESEPALVEAINHHSPAELARWAADHGVPLLHYSTDYVYHGQGDQPFREDDAAAYGPLNHYGQSKLNGDLTIQRAGGRHLILRTSWVYAAYGQNFLLTMLKLGRERQELRIVADQTGSPSYAADIAETTLALLPQWLARPESDGIYHCCPPQRMNWHGFAERIFTEARRQNLPLAIERLIPIATADYPTPAQRPANSRLSVEKLRQTFGLTLPDVDDALRRCIAAYVAARQTD